MSAVTNNYFVHQLAICDSEHIGAGTRIWAFSHVLAGAQIGSHCNLGEHVFVENKVTIGDRCTIKNGVALWDFVTLEAGVFVGPYVVFTNDLRPRAFIRRPSSTFLPTRLKRGATIGANSTLVCGVTVGEYAFVGAGSVVVQSLAPHDLAIGNPARVIGRVCYCGSKLDERDFCRDCERSLNDNSEEQVVLKYQRNSEAFRPAHF